jgi:hypothetical protein
MRCGSASGPAATAALPHARRRAPHRLRPSLHGRDHLHGSHLHPLRPLPNGGFELVFQTDLGEHGPHPDLASDFELFCDVLVPVIT